MTEQVYKLLREVLTEIRAEGHFPKDFRRTGATYIAPWQPKDRMQV